MGLYLCHTCNQFSHRVARLTAVLLRCAASDCWLGHGRGNWRYIYSFFVGYTQLPRPYVTCDVILITFHASRIILVRRLSKIIQQQQMNKHVATANFTQQIPLGGVIQKMNVVGRS